MQKRHCVGARSLAAIKADPLATAQEVLTLSSVDAVCHPNCPVATWWQVAEIYPLEAQGSVLYHLLTLEEPERWFALERKHGWYWVKSVTSRLSAKDQRLFAADCAEHVLPLFEAVYPDEKAPRHVIDLKRECQGGKVPYPRIEAVQAAALQVVQKAQKAALAASNKLNPLQPIWEDTQKARALHAAERAARAALAAGGMHANSASAANYAAMAVGELLQGKAADSATEEESVWQWERLQDYLYKQAKIGGLHSVGARTRGEILADPMATAEEVKSLKKKHPLDVLNHPNCPEELWWQLVGKYPLEAPQSPLWELNLLSTPERWKKLQEDKTGAWIRAYANKLPDEPQRLFAVECARRVLPIFEQKYPKDTTPRRALVAAEWFAKGVINARSLAEGRDAAKTLASQMPNSAATYSVLAAAAAANATASTASWDATGYAAYASKMAMQGPTLKERSWQWERLQDYLRAERLL